MIVRGWDDPRLPKALERGETVYMLPEWAETAAALLGYGASFVLAVTALVKVLKGGDEDEE